MSDRITVTVRVDRDEDPELFKVLEPLRPSARSELARLGTRVAVRTPMSELSACAYGSRTLQSVQAPAEMPPAPPSGRGARVSRNLIAAANIS